MKTTFIAALSTFTLTALAAPVSDTTSSNWQYAPAVVFQTDITWDVSHCGPEVQPSERKYCSTNSFTMSQIANRNQQCNSFPDGTVSINMQQYDARQCDFIAYEESGCSGNEYHLGQVGMLSLPRYLMSYKFVCKFD